MTGKMKLFIKNKLKNEMPFYNKRHAKSIFNYWIDNFENPVIHICPKESEDPFMEDLMVLAEKSVIKQPLTAEPVKPEIVGKVKSWYEKVYGE